MKLHQLKYTKGSRRHKVKVYGRGYGSVGKRGGRGNKGQGQRKSGNVRLGFEGGQTPIYRKVGKVGFNNANFRQQYNVITLKQIEANGLENISLKTLTEKRIVKNKLPIKVIGNTKLTKKVNFEIHKISAGAKKAIEAAGGKVSIIK